MNNQKVNLTIKIIIVFNKLVIFIKNQLFEHI